MSMEKMIMKKRWNKWNFQSSFRMN